MKKVITLIFTILSICSLSAQKLYMCDFNHLSDDISAAIEQVKDANGDPCALIKVGTTALNPSFDGPIVKTIKRGGEYWVYVVQETDYLNITSDNYLPVRAEFQSVQSNNTYELMLCEDKSKPQMRSTGFLIFTSTPSGAKVFITEDNKENYVGNTPYQQKMLYGTYSYRLQTPLYRDEVGVVTVDNPRVIKDVALSPAFGSVKVTTNPSGATITVETDGRTFTSPCEITKLPSGTHTLTVTYPGYAISQSKITVTDGCVIPLNIELDARFAPITINTLAGATVKVNGEVLGKGSLVKQLDEGIYDVEVSMAQHRTVTRQIEVIANQPQTIEITPTPIYGSLDVVSTPMFSDVVINGKLYGTTPTTIENLLIGEYDVSISKKGCASITRKVTITDGQLSAIEVDLPQGREYTITSDRNGDDVYIDGVKRGVTPLAVSLSFGNHDVELRRDGKTTKKTIAVSQSGTANVLHLAFGLTPQWQAGISPSTKQILQRLIDNMVQVEGGTFRMGSSYEKPIHRVTLSDFCIGKYEVTQEEWEAVMGNNPSKFKGANKPVERVSWNDCQEFIKKLNDLTGLQFRLPTEAEWEYAARGGNKSQGYKYSGSNTIGEVAWYYDNSSSTQPVGTKAPNELGLYDMSGNVWEWCSDWYSSSYYSSSPTTNPTGPATGSSHVSRGGATGSFRVDFRDGRWFSRADHCRVAFRDGDSPDDSRGIIGFRLALSLKKNRVTVRVSSKAGRKRKKISE